VFFGFRWAAARGSINRLRMGPDGCGVPRRSTGTEGPSQLGPSAAIEEVASRESGSGGAPSPPDESVKAEPGEAGVEVVHGQGCTSQ
jgi:hypothetical protein